jgi:hypothetical protein
MAISFCITLQPSCGVSYSAGELVRREEGVGDACEVFFSVKYERKNNELVVLSSPDDGYGHDNRKKKKK